MANGIIARRFDSTFPKIENPSDDTVVMAFDETVGLNGGIPLESLKDEIYKRQFFGTVFKLGGIGEYAPIWRAQVTVNQSYMFQIWYLGFTSDYFDEHGQRPLIGRLDVAFAAKPDAAELDPDRVTITHTDAHGQDGDFVIQDNGSGLVTIYVRKTAWNQSTQFGYIGAFSTTNTANLVNQGVYEELPVSTGSTIESTLSDGVSLPDNIVDALKAANSPNAANRFITADELNLLAPPVEYNMPTVTLNTNQLITGKEVGEVLDAVLTSSFVKNDAGNTTKLEFLKDGSVIHTVNTPSSPVTYTDEDIELSTTPIVYTARITFEQGPVKNNVLGNPSPGRIEAGDLTSATRTAVGTYVVCYGPVASVPTNSAQARALNKTVRGSGNVIVINSGTTFTTQVVIIPPGSSLGAVIDLDASMQDLTIQYNLVNNNFTVNDASGDPVSGYKLYVRTQGTPYLTNHRHQITMI